MQFPLSFSNTRAITTTLSRKTQMAEYTKVFLRKMRTSQSSKEQYAGIYDEVKLELAKHFVVKETNFVEQYPPMMSYHTVAINFALSLDNQIYYLAIDKDGGLSVYKAGQSIRMGTTLEGKYDAKVVGNWFHSQIIYLKNGD